MTATLGAVPITCPVCGRELRVPVFASGPHLASAGHPLAASLHLDVDVEYLRAHWLTHDQYDGEPMAA